MEQFLALSIFKGYTIFFLWILANRLGLPLPVTPALLAAGALSAMGQWRLLCVLSLAVAATLLSDTVWFELSRRYGRLLLKAVCRFMPQPHVHVRRAEDFLARYGAGCLLVAKFVPGMNRTVMSLTGPARLGLGQFLMLDFLGALLWVGTYAAIGYAFSDALHEALHHSITITRYSALVCLVVVLVAALGGLIVHRYRRTPGDSEVLDEPS